MTEYFNFKGSEHVTFDNRPGTTPGHGIFYPPILFLPGYPPFRGGAYGGQIPRKWHREFTRNPSIGHDSERSVFPEYPIFQDLFLPFSLTPKH
jgi:hypothetical protein